MSDEKRVIRGKMEIAGLVGPLWFTGWLFTIGYVHLPFIKAVWALIFWPYYLGSTLGG
jgi:hypothetical protein